MKTKTIKTKKCLLCKKLITKSKFCSVFVWYTRTKYCSRKCVSKSRIGKTAWNKGTIGVMKPNKTSFKKGSVSPNKGKKLPSIQGEKNPSWKGDKVGYHGIHKWIYRCLGRPNKCMSCGRIKYGKKMHWANIDHKYRREISDWIRMCADCHVQYDKNILNRYDDTPA